MFSWKELCSFTLQTEEESIPAPDNSMWKSREIDERVVNIWGKLSSSLSLESQRNQEKEEHLHEVLTGMLSLVLGIWGFWTKERRDLSKSGFTAESELKEKSLKIRRLLICVMLLWLPNNRRGSPWSWTRADGGEGGEEPASRGSEDLGLGPEKPL